MTDQTIFAKVTILSTSAEDAERALREAVDLLDTDAHVDVTATTAHGLIPPILAENHQGILRELIATAVAGYEAETGTSQVEGENLLEFILEEICETFDGDLSREDAYAAAIRVTRRIASDTLAVVAALETAQSKAGTDG